MSEHSRFALTVTRLGAVALFAGALLAGCTSGQDGSPGANGPAGPPGGPGTPGTPGPVLALDISTAQTVKATITGVTGGSQPTVAFTLVDQNGQPLSGLKCPQIHFAIAALTPGAGGSSSYWLSYINSVQQPGTPPTGAVAWWGTTPTRQATNEPGFSGACPGTFTDNGDGTYSYQFAKDLGAYTPADAQGPAVAYDGTLTHRIGLELRGTGPNGTDNGVNNAAYTYVPATGSTTVLPASREIVSNTECYACHTKLQFHGGPRTDVQYCVLCHNPGTTDAQSGNTLDFKVMIHKLHRGATLPTVVAAGSTAPAQGVGYTIWGFQNSLSNYNTLVFPQDTRNCTTCHKTAADADNYETVANRASCGSCHDDVDFATGAGHVQFSQNPGGINQPDDTKCLTCHGQGTGTISPISGASVETAAAHVIPQLELAKQFKFTVLRVESVTAWDAATLTGTPGAVACAPTATVCTVLPGEFPLVTIQITNPQDGSVYALTDAPFTNTYTSSSGSTTTARVRGRVAYTTLNYTNPGASTGTSATQAGLIDFLAATGVRHNADGSYTAVASQPLPTTPALAGGTGAVSVEGRAILNLAPPALPVANGNVPITAADPLYFLISDASAVARRDVVDTANCLRCHKSLQTHGDARNNNVRLCVMCHNPAQAPRVQATGQPAGSSGSEPVDLKFFIHSLHSANYKFGRLDFSDVGFPGLLNNCLGCHKTDTYYPVDPAKVFATSIDAGTAYDDPTQHIAITANAAACGACHTDSAASLHMHQNGAVVISDQLVGGLQFGAPNTPAPTVQYIKAADGSTKAQYQTESCSVCHGPGAVADVKVVHKIAAYQ